MATELEEADLTGDDLGYIAEAARIRAAMDRQAALAEKQRAEAAARADREAAQMEAAKLLQDGATPQEVTRLLGHRLYGGSPATFERAMRFAAPPAPRPEIPPPYPTNFPGVPGTFIVETDRFGQARTKPVRPPSLPPDAAAQQKLLEQEITSIRRQLADPLSVAPKPDLTNALKKAEAAYLSGAKSVAAPAAPRSEVVRVTKDGRRAIFDAATKQFIRYEDAK